MIVSTWQFLQKEVLWPLSLGRAVKGVKLTPALKVWQAKPGSIHNLLVPDKVQVQRVISTRSDQGYHEIGHFWIASYLDDQAGL